MVRQGALGICWRRLTAAVAVAVLSLVLFIVFIEPVSAASTNTVEGETMALKGTTVLVRTNGSASGGKEIAFYSGGASFANFQGSASTVTLRARETACGGHAKLQVYVDGVDSGTVTLSSSSFLHYPLPLSNLADGAHELKVVYKNDYRTSRCDRNAFLDYSKLTLPDPTVPPTTANPLQYLNFAYLAPDTHARRTADQWYAAGRTADAQQMEKVAKNPRTYYFAEWTVDNPSGTTALVNYRVRKAMEQGAVPILGAYAIPYRDCSYYSAGGFATSGEYLSWTRDFAAGIGDAKAVVILEPDANAVTECLTEVQRQERWQTMSQAVDIYKSHPNTLVYIASHTPDDEPTRQLMADRLRMAGVMKADGFATNVSQFDWTQEEMAAGDSISSKLGGKHYLIDTSRNGVGSYKEGDEPWCNPPGRALGSAPTTDTVNPRVDAFLWLKYPGESDGACNGSTRAGEWMPEYALDLARRAAW